MRNEPMSRRRSRPLAELLGMSGVVVSVSLTIVLIGFFDEFESGIYRTQFDSLATSFSITKAQPHGVRATGIQSLSDSDVRALRRDLDPSLVSHVIPIAQGAAIIQHGNRQFHGGLVGGPPDYVSYLRTPLLAGSMFTQQQVRDNARVVLLGPGVVQALFGGDGSAALGSDVLIGRLSFRVIGLVGKDATGGDAAVSLAPITTVRRSLLGGIRTVGTIGVVATSVASVPMATQQATQILEREHTPHKTGLQDDFTTTTFQSAQPAVARRLVLTLFWFALAVALICFVTGSAGLASVLGARAPEQSGIGPVRAATRLLAGPVLVSVVSAVLGVGLGVAAAWVGEPILASAAPQLGEPHLLRPSAIASGIGLSLLAGLLVGSRSMVRVLRSRSKKNRSTRRRADMRFMRLG